MGVPRLMMDRTMAALERAAEGSWMRQQVAAANLANAETPGYRALRVEFEAALAEALRASARGDTEAIWRVRPRVRPSTSPALRWDGNNVSPERELVALAEGALQHETVVRLLARKFRMLRMVISGRAG